MCHPSLTLKKNGFIFAKTNDALDALVTLKLLRIRNRPIIRFDSTRPVGSGQRIQLHQDAYALPPEGPGVMAQSTAQISPTFPASAASECNFGIPGTKVSVAIHGVNDYHSHT